MVAPANRLDQVKEYYFSVKLREIEALNKSGLPVINLGIGSPDLAPDNTVIATLAEEAAKSTTHAYQPYKGGALLRDAFATWYKNYFRVELNSETEVLPLLGSKEGIVYTTMAFVGAGDKVLVPDPGYPAYRAATLLAGAECEFYNLTAKNNWLPDIAELEKRDLSKVKLMWINYPNMPTGVKANKQVLEELVVFARKHNILLINDNPYSFILNTDLTSLLQVSGAKEDCLELNSLSKSHNMAGWRVGVITGNATALQSILQFKSNIDSGMFYPVQAAAAQALSLGNDWFTKQNEIYERRRSLVWQLLDKLDCKYSKDQCGLFVWASIPTKYETGFQLSDEILQRWRVFITPGGIFGNNGNAYIRVSLCQSEEKMKEALERIG